MIAAKFVGLRKPSPTKYIVKNSAPAKQEQVEPRYCTPEKVLSLQDTIRNLKNFTAEAKKRRNRNEVATTHFSPFMKSTMKSSIVFTQKGVRRSRSKRGIATQSFVKNDENTAPSEKKLQEVWKTAPQKYS
jgi:hypothetical protein